MKIERTRNHFLSDVFATSLSSDLKVMLQGRFATTMFSATKDCNINATLFEMIATLFQHCNAALR